MTVDIPSKKVASRARVGRVAPTRIGAVGKAVGSSTTAVTTTLGSLASRYTSTPDAWAEKPASVRACLEYTREGGWMPGDHAPWLETLGKAYGYGIAVPATALLDGIEWVVQKPTRLFLLILAGVLLKVAASMLIG